MKYIIVLLFLIIHCWGDEFVVFSNYQDSNIKLVKTMALSFPDKNGDTWENTLGSICMTESSCGINLLGDKGSGWKKSSSGLMQIQLNTAKFMFKKYKMNEFLTLTDREIFNQLMTNKVFNIFIATTYMNWLSNHRKKYFNKVSGYNGGWNNKPYYTRVMKCMKRVKRIKLDNYDLIKNLGKMDFYQKNINETELYKKVVKSVFENLSKIEKINHN